MTPDPLKDLLDRRDALVVDLAQSREVDALQFIENEEIRELGRIVLETTTEETVTFSTT